MKKFFDANKNNPWFWIFLAITIILFFLLPIRSLDAGNSGDEDTWQYPHSVRVYNYYTTFGKDTSYKAVPEMNPYGMWYETIIVGVCKAFHIDNYQTARHIFNSLMGFLAILSAALLAKNISGWRAAVFTLLLFAFSPRFIGHAFNNPKDVPFAAIFMLSLFLIYKLIQEYPKPSIKRTIFTAIVIGLTIGIRIGGLLLYAYLGFFVVIYYIWKNKASTYFEKNNLKIAGRYLISYISIIVLAFGLAILTWPYLLEAPIQHTKDTFDTMSQYSIALRQLFEGSLQWSDVLPWYYTPKYIFMTIPIAVIVGLVLFFVCCWRKKEDRFWAFFVFFTFFFPVFWIVFTKANVYGGWRHAMFAYPPMVVAAGWGFDALVKWIESKLGINNEQLIINNEDGKKVSAEKYNTKQENDGRDAINRVSAKGILVNVASVIVLLVLLIGPIRHICANHPYEYVYFNELAGGVDKAYGNYELDYYYHSTREASEWIIANAEPNPDGSKIKVATWHTASVGYFFRNDTAKFAPLFSRWYEKGNNDWDYAIFTITGMAPEQIKNAGAFPPPDCIKTIDVDGKPICLILKRQSKIDMLGNQYKSKNQVDSAIISFKEALAINPYNEAALNNIIECYLMRGQLDSAKTYIDHELSFLPKYETANYFLAHYYMTKGEMDKAIETCKYIIDCNFKFTGAYHLMCNIYLRQNDVKNAEKILGQLIDHDQLDNAGVQQLIQIYKADGLDDRGAYRKLYKKMAKSLESRGKKKDAQVYWDLYKQLR